MCQVPQAGDQTLTRAPSGWRQLGKHRQSVHPKLAASVDRPLANGAHPQHCWERSARRAALPSAGLRSQHQLFGMLPHGSSGSPWFTELRRASGSLRWFAEVAPCNNHSARTHSRSICSGKKPWARSQGTCRVTAPKLPRQWSRRGPRLEKTKASPLTTTGPEMPRSVLLAGARRPRRPPCWTELALGRRTPRRLRTHCGYLRHLGEAPSLLS